MQLTIASSAGAKKKTGGRLTIDDFLPAFAKAKKAKPVEQQEQELKAFFKGMSKRNKKNGK